MCRDFNMKNGRCLERGHCQFGRLNECAVCGATHRGLDNHSRATVCAALGIPDKGKGKNKDKGKGKGGKNKNKDAEKKS